MTIEPRFLTISEVMEIHDQEIVAAGGLSFELADKTLELVEQKITKSDLAQHLKSRSKEIK